MRWLLLPALLFAACGGPSGDPEIALYDLDSEIRFTNSSDAAMYLLLDMEALAQQHPEINYVGGMVMHGHTDDERPLVRSVAIGALARTFPDHPEATPLLHGFILDPKEPLSLREALLRQTTAADFPSREFAAELLRTQAAQTGRRVNLD